MHGQGNHGANLGKIHLYQAVVIGQIRRGQCFIIAAAAVHGQVIVGDLVGAPDAGQTGGLGGHHINTTAVFQRQLSNAGAHKFHHLVLHIAGFEHRADDGQRHVLWAHTHCGLSGQIHCHHTGAGHIIGAAQQLLGQLAATLTNGHGAQRTVTGMAVRSEDHLSAAGVHLTHILVDNRQVRRHINAAIFFGSGKTKQVVILVDGAAHCTQTVVAVGEHIGHRKLFQPGSPGGLHNAHKGDVVAGHGIEFQLQHLRVATLIVCLQNAVGNGAGMSILHRIFIKAQSRQLCGGLAVCLHPLTAGVVHAGLAASYH